MERPIITKANFDTLSAKIDNYNSVNDILALGEIQQRAKKLFSKEIPIEILQCENHQQEFRGWLMREVNPVIEFDDGKKKEIAKNPQPDNELGDFVFREATPEIPKKFDFTNVPKDGVGFETDKGIFTYDEDSDKFCNRATGEQADLNEILSNAKDLTLLFDVNNDGKNILRGTDAEKAIQEKLAQHKEFWARSKTIVKVDLKAKPKTNAEKLQQCIKKAQDAYLNSKKVVKNPARYITAEGVKMFLLATPSVKLEQMTKLIDYVAPMSAFDSAERKFSERVKEAVRQDAKFQAKFAANKKSVTQKGR